MHIIEDPFHEHYLRLVFLSTTDENTNSIQILHYFKPLGRYSTKKLYNMKRTPTGIV